MSEISQTESTMEDYERILVIQIQHKKYNVADLDP